MSTSNGNGVINRVFISDGDDHVKEVNTDDHLYIMDTCLKFMQNYRNYCTPNCELICFLNGQRKTHEKRFSKKNPVHFLFTSMK